MESIKVVNYLTKSGKEPFEEWLAGIDSNTRAIIRIRLGRVRLGNLGECKPIKGAKKIWEMIIDYGPGYRIYFGRSSQTIIILLIAGLKRSQLRDIEKAKKYWLDYEDKK